MPLIHWILLLFQIQVLGPVEGDLYLGGRFRSAFELHEYEAVACRRTAEQLEQEFTDMIHSWQWEYWSLCNLHLALAEPPAFKAAESDPEINNSFLYVLGYESMADLKGHWAREF